MSSFHHHPPLISFPKKALLSDLCELVTVHKHIAQVDVHVDMIKMQTHTSNAVNSIDVQVFM